MNIHFLMGCSEVTGQPYHAISLSFLLHDDEAKPQYPIAHAVLDWSRKKLRYAPC